MAPKKMGAPKLSSTDIGSLKAAELRIKLTNAKIVMNDGALKPELQALYALWSLGLLSAKEKPDEGLLAVATEYCASTVKVLLEELGERDIVVTGYRWDHVEGLIRDEYKHVIQEQDDAEYGTDVNEVEVTSGKKKKANRAKFSARPKKDQEADNPEPEVVNLLLTMIYSHVHRLKTPVSLPGNTNNSITQLKNLNELPQFHNVDDLAATLAPAGPKSSAHALLTSILETYGSIIVPATGDLKIPHFPDEVLQFVVAKPANSLQEAFDRAQGEENSSRLFFHGTPMSNLHSILTDGFKLQANLVWCHTEPSYSWNYALKNMWMPKGKTANTQWKNTPFLQYGALLGCEVLGSGAKFLRRSGAYTTSQPHELMVRYIFLIPPVDQNLALAVPAATVAAPTREQVESAMLVGLKRIRDMRP